jgi:hypothetical protein
MRQSAVVFIGALFAVVSASPSFAKTETVTGQLIDLACFHLNQGNTANAHKGKGYNCAQACAKEGFAVGILTADRKLYEVTGDLAANKNVKLVTHMAHTVTVTGDVSEKNGQMMITASDLKMITK